MAPRKTDARWFSVGEYHEDHGNVLWVHFPEDWYYEVYFGTPLDSDWPGDEYTHWLPLPEPPEELLGGI